MKKSDRPNMATLLMKAWILNSPEVYREADRLGRDIIACIQDGTILPEDACIHPEDASIDWQEVQRGIDAINWHRMPDR